MNNSKVQVQGTVAPGFESVRTLFIQNFESAKENNAQCCAYVGDEKVVDLWGTAIGDFSYNGDSLQNVFSSTKSVTAIAIASLVDKKLIQYGDKIHQYWPEFAKNGKENLTLDKVMKHEGGMSWFNHTFKLQDLLTENIKQNSIGKVIEDEPLRFPPEESGTTREYHALTRGWILNEIFRRVDPEGKTIGEWLREEICDPLGIDVYIGVKGEEKKRICDLSSWKKGYVLFQSMIPQALGRKVEPNLIDFINFARMIKNQPTVSKPPAMEILEENESLSSFGPKFNYEEIRCGEMPSANGNCSARGLAKLAAFMANKGELNGVKLMSEETWNLMHDQLEKKPDTFMGAVTQFSQGGVNYWQVYGDEPAKVKILKQQREHFYGWGGFGGSVFQWHPELKIGFAYAPTLLAWYDINNTKAAQLQNEVVKCVKRRNQGLKIEDSE